MNNTSDHDHRLQRVVAAAAPLANEHGRNKQLAVAAEAACVELNRRIEVLLRQARSDEKRCFGKVCGKGPEYFDGYKTALTELRQWIETRPIQQAAGGNDQALPHGGAERTPNAK